jgi:hypothetical protein
LNTSNQENIRATRILRNNLISGLNKKKKNTFGIKQSLIR